MADQWFDNAQLSRNFQVALLNADALDDSNVGEFLTHPQRWNDEYSAWEDAGFPNDEDDAGWDQFVEAITSEENESEDEDESDE